MMAKKQYNIEQSKKAETGKRKELPRASKRNQIQLKLKIKSQKTPNIPKISPHNYEFYVFFIYILFIF